MTTTSRRHRVPVKSVTKKTRTTAAAVSSAAPVLLAAVGAALRRSDGAEAPQTWTGALNYYVDLVQRSVLFLDVLRERGDKMLAHERAGQRPLLEFEHELILDARTFERPANYALLRITRCRRRWPAGEYGARERR